MMFAQGCRGTVSETLTLTITKKVSTTSLHRERSSAKGKGQEGPIQGRRKHGDVM